jgi:hypothetical protein
MGSALVRLFSNWLSHINQVFPFEIVTATSFEECLDAIRGLRRRPRWFNHGWVHETRVILTQIDINTCHFDIDRIPYRFVPLRADGVIRRSDGVFAIITGQVRTNNALFLVWGPVLASGIVFLTGLALEQIMIIYIPVTCFMTGLLLAYGYVLNRFYSKRLGRDIQRSVAYSDELGPVHKPKRKRKAH